jgi:hypothetical protein
MTQETVTEESFIYWPKNEEVGASAHKSASEVGI